MKSAPMDLSSPPTTKKDTPCREPRHDFRWKEGTVAEDPDLCWSCGWTRGEVRAWIKKGGHP